MTAGAPFAEINLAALRHNLGRVRDMAPGAKIMAVVKANAYGHGAVEIARELIGAGAEALAVARLDEAVALRAAAVEAPIILLEGVADADGLAAALQARCEIVVHALAQARALAAARPPSTAAPARVWLKCETGMHRLGLAAEDIEPVTAALRPAAWVAPALGWMTHLADAGEELGAHPDESPGQNPAARVRAQLAQFNKLTGQQPGPRSAANSAGVCAYPDSHHDWLRPGIMLYGASPLAGVTAAQLDLKPVMTLRAPILAIEHIAAGERVGYGGQFTATAATNIATVAVGYGDGYPRRLGGRAEVLIDGERRPVVGRVSMDKIAVDVTGGNARPGDLVTLWGDGLPVDEVAARAETIGYELLSGIAARVPRRYSHSCR